MFSEKSHEKKIFKWELTKIFHMEKISVSKSLAKLKDKINFGAVSSPLLY